MATTADFRTGLCLEHNGQLWTLIDFLRFQTGRGSANVRTKLKNLETGKVIEHTFSSGEKINPIRIERRKYQFLYREDKTYHFMNTETFDQIQIQEELVNAPEFLRDGDEVDIVFHAEEERPLICELNPSVILEVTYTEPGIKGDTATNTLKPATVETGAEVRVPLFVNLGDKIKVDTRTGTYIERA